MDQQIGPIRTKPGRGAQTASVSFSDKLARWNCMGIQGSLLHMLLDKILYFESITICGSVQFTVQRTVLLRFNTDNAIKGPFGMQRPVVQASNNVLFGFAKSSERTQPAPGSIAWCKTGQRLGDFLKINFYFLF